MQWRYGLKDLERIIMKMLDLDRESALLLSEKFFVQIKELVVRIEAAIDHRNFSDLSFCAHSLKGSASILGIDAIVLLAEQMQHCAEQFSPTDASKPVNALQGLCQKLTLILEEMNQSFDSGSNLGDGV